jgi:hypothetical protein
METDRTDWRRGLRREVAWLLLAKLAGLLLLWALFFSAAHRIDADHEHTADKWGVRPTPPVSGEPDHG